MATSFCFIDWFGAKTLALHKISVVRKYTSDDLPESLRRNLRSDIQGFCIAHRSDGIYICKVNIENSDLDLQNWMSDTLFISSFAREEIVGKDKISKRFHSNSKVSPVLVENPREYIERHNNKICESDAAALDAIVNSDDHICNLRSLDKSNLKNSSRIPALIRLKRKMSWSSEIVARSLDGAIQEVKIYSIKVRRLCNIFFVLGLISVFYIVFIEAAAGNICLYLCMGTDWKANFLPPISLLLLFSQVFRYYIEKRKLKPVVYKIVESIELHKNYLTFFTLTERLYKFPSSHYDKDAYLSPLDSLYVKQLFRYKDKIFNIKTWLTIFGFCLAVMIFFARYKYGLADL